MYSPFWAVVLVPFRIMFIMLLMLIPVVGCRLSVICYVFQLLSTYLMNANIFVPRESNSFAISFHPFSRNILFKNSACEVASNRDE